MKKALVFKIAMGAFDGTRPPVITLNHASNERAEKCITKAHIYIHITKFSFVFCRLLRELWGLAQRAFEEATKYSLERKTMGKPIAMVRIVLCCVALRCVVSFFPRSFKISPFICKVSF